MGSRAIQTMGAIVQREHGAAIPRRATARAYTGRFFMHARVQRRRDASSRVGAGAVWSGEGMLASPWLG